MVFWEIAEVCVGILIFLFLLTQVLIPLYRGVPYFPLFKKKRRKLEEELSGVREEKDEKAIKQEIQQEKKGRA